MKSPLALLAALAVVTATPARADAPKVVTDIAPVQALAARVMQGVGTPASIIPASGSPHHYSMRPSDADAIANADVVFHIAGLVPWFEDTVGKLTSGAEVVDLMGVPGVKTLEARTEHDHDHGHGDDDHGHGDDDHAHGEKEHGEDDHAHGEKEHGDDDHAHGEKAHGDDDHAHGEHGVDPHAWLDPDNAAVWMSAMAVKLGTLDPANAATYAKNAADGAAELQQLSAEISAQLQPVVGRPFVLYHDATYYFEARFGLETIGAVTLTDDAAPVASHIEELRETIGDRGAVCLMLESGPEPKIARTIVDNLDVKLGTIDPIGRDLEPGPDYYPMLLKALAAGFADCLAQLPE